MTSDADSAAKAVDMLDILLEFFGGASTISDYQVTVDSPFTREPIIVTGLRHDLLQ
jgi:hypothetical protein